MEKPVYTQPTPFRPVSQPGGGRIAVLSQPVGSNAALAAALMRGTGGGARSIGHGIGQAATKIAAAGLAKREREQAAQRNETLARLLTDPNATEQDVAAGFAAAGDYSFAKDLYQRRHNPPKRERAQDMHGRMRYVDDGSPVFADIEPPRPKGGFVTFTGPDGNDVTVRDDDPRADALIGQGYVKRSKPAAEVNIANKSETEEAKAIGKFLGEGYSETQKAGDAARSALTAISRADAVLSKVPTGGIESATLGLRQMGVSLGLFSKEEAQKVGAQEALRSIAVDFALKRVGETKGAVSNAEMDLFLKASVGLENSPEGNRIILDGARRIFQRQREIASLQRQYRSGKELRVGDQVFKNENPGSVDGFRDFADVYNDANPVFDESFRKSLSSAPEVQGEQVDIPPAPEGFDATGWVKMSPEERREALELLGGQ